MGRQPRRRHALARRLPPRTRCRGRCASAATRPASPSATGAVWVAGGEDGHRRARRSRGPRVLTPTSTREQPVRGRRSPTARCGRRRPPRRRRTVAARCAWSSPSPCRIRAANWLTGDGYDLETLDADVAGLRRPRRLPPRRRRRGRDAGRRARHATAAAEPRRPDVRLHAAQGAALLRRQPGAPGGLPRVDGALPARRRADGFPPYFAGIVGARRCMRRRGPLRPLARHRDRCAARARSPSTSRTPDAEFLHKLTMPFAFVVPAGTPASASLDLAPPGTGPVPGRRVGLAARRALVRNPRFRATADAAGGVRRPDRVHAHHVQPQREDRGGGRAWHDGRDVRCPTV